MTDRRRKCDGRPLTRGAVVPRRAVGSRAVAARVARAARRRWLGVPDLARRMVRPWAVGLRGLGGGAASWRPSAHRDHRPGPASVWPRRPSSSTGATTLKRRFLRPMATGARSVVPAVQRARLRVGSRRPGDSGRPRRRRVGRERAEAVEHERQPRRVRPARREDRLGRHQAPRPHVLRDRYAAARCRGSPGSPDERACLVQRGVPHRCQGARRRHHRRTRRGLAGRADDAGPRAAARPPASTSPARSRRRTARWSRRRRRATS